MASRLAKKFNIIHISTGDIFRENIKNQTELGKKAESIINQGNLIPDHITNELMKDRLSRDDCANGYILDGYPRNMAQAEYLDSNVQLDTALLLDVPEEVSIKRISSRRTCSACGTIFNTLTLIPKKEGICDACNGQLIQRDDDKEEAVKKRLNIYHEQTEPLLTFYKEKGILKKIDGSKSVEEVFTACLEALS